MIRKNIIVKGKVQGVYFRKYTQWKAEELKITGFVRNEADGSVYIEVQGEEEQVELLVKWCRLGSPLSKVELVDASEMALIDGEKEFTMIH